jgi:hypothetical protein
MATKSPNFRRKQRKSRSLEEERTDAGSFCTFCTPSRLEPT